MEHRGKREKGRAHGLVGKQEREKMTHAEIEPWPRYDDKGNDWWSIRVMSRQAIATLAYSRRLRRFAESNELDRIAIYHPRLLERAEAEVARVFAC
jgi:hypothetical protein